MMKKGIFSLLFFGLSGFGWCGTAGWTTITAVTIGGDSDRVNVKTSDDIQNPLPCSSTGYYQMNEDAANHDSVLSIALIALTTGREVKIKYSDTECSDGNRPRLRGIEVR